MNLPSPKFCIVIACGILLVLGLMFRSGTEEFTGQADFHAAAAAFDAGDFARAVDLYHGLLASGVQSADVEYNLGNALYRDGRRGDAVLAWRRAWQQAPRDADIRANLRFAMSEGEAVMPKASAPEVLIESVPLRHWAGMTTLAWWTLWALAAIAAASTSFRPAFRRLAPPLALVVGVGLVASHHWTTGNERELVITEATGTRALYAPLADADPHFDLPSGSIVELRERASPWLKIAVDDREGWIREAVATPVATGT